MFPNWAALNNAILLDRPGSAVAAAAAADLRGVFDDAGGDSWALWLPSHGASFAAPDAVHEVEGMVRDTTTLVMGVDIAQQLPRDARVVRTSVAAATRATDEPLPAGELPGPDADSDMDAWVLV